MNDPSIQLPSNHTVQGNTQRPGEKAAGSDVGGEMSSYDAKPFRFLHLPKELRLMVYERLPIIRTHVRYHRGAAFTLVVNTPPTSILATCRTINVEAASFIGKKVTQADASPVKIMVDIASVQEDPQEWVTNVDQFSMDMLPNWFGRAAYRIPYHGLHEHFDIAKSMEVEVALTDLKGLTRSDPWLGFQELSSALWFIAEACNFVSHYTLRVVPDGFPDLAQYDANVAAGHRAIRSNLAYTIEQVGPPSDMIKSLRPRLRFAQGKPIESQEWVRVWTESERLGEMSI